MKKSLLFTFAALSGVSGFSNNMPFTRNSLLKNPHSSIGKCARDTNSLWGMKNSEAEGIEISITPLPEGATNGYIKCCNEVKSLCSDKDIHTEIITRICKKGERKLFSICDPVHTHNYRIVIGDGGEVVINEQNIKGPAFVNAAISQGEICNILLKGDVSLTKYHHYIHKCGVSSGVYSNKSKLRCDEKYRKNPEAALFAQALADILREVFSSKNGLKISKENSSKAKENLQIFGGVPTIRCYTVSSLQDSSEYIMGFGNQIKGNYDNAGHIHSGQRIESHLTGPETVGIIMSWDAIVDSKKQNVHQLVIDDPITESKKLHIYLIPPASEDFVCLPVASHHKFKPALSPEVYKLCSIIYNKILNEGDMDKDIYEPQHAVINLYRRDKNDFLSKSYLQDIFEECGGKDKVCALLDGSEAYIILTQHPREREEIKCVNEKITKDGKNPNENIRSMIYGGSISAQTVFLEPDYQLSEETCQMIIAASGLYNTICWSSKRKLYMAIKNDYLRTCKDGNIQSSWKYN